MSQLSVEVVKRSCAFVLEIQEPVETLKKLVLFFKDRHIVIDSMVMHRHINDNANLIIHCQIEKDRIWRTVQMMEQLPGIVDMERMEGK